MYQRTRGIYVSDISKLFNRSIDTSISFISQDNNVIFVHVYNCDLQTAFKYLALNLSKYESTNQAFPEAEAIIVYQRSQISPDS